jgi:hypothetical protein
VSKIKFWIICLLYMKGNDVTKKLLFSVNITSRE